MFLILLNSGVCLQLAKMAGRAWIFYVSPLLTIPLFLLPRLARDRRTQFLLIGGVIGLCASSIAVFFNINYLAPIVPVLMAVIIQGMRHLRVWRFEGRPSGRFLVRAIVVMCVVMIPVQVRIFAASPLPGSWAAIGPGRVAVEKQLRSLPGDHLLLVRYNLNHDPLLEWVFNEADIGTQRVIWARDMGQEKNAELLRYYPNRRAWQLEGDTVPPRLSPYSDNPLAN